MNHRLHIHKKACSQSASTPTSNLFQSLPFAVPETATPTPQETPDLRQQQEMEQPKGMNLLEIPNLVAGSSPLPEPPQALRLQAKLTIGEPGDRYEQEADRVAADVVQRIHSPSPQVQREEIKSVGDEQMQMSPFVQQWRNALVQRREQESTEEEQIRLSPIGPHWRNSLVQRQEQQSTEEEQLRMSPIGPHWRNSLVQRQDVQDEEQVMMKPQVSFLQREEMQELNLKSNIQNPKSEGMGAAPNLEASIQGARGSGQPLDESVREPMEREFGADFSGVRVHTDAKSDVLNQSIQAKAFTTGQDVFFRQGAYEPSSRGGQELIAHELTHVVQQSGGVMQRKPQPQKGIQNLNFLSTTALPRRSIQRVVINQSMVAGLTADLDTTILDAAKLLINSLHDRGKRKSLAELYTKIKQADQQENTDNNKELIKFIEGKLDLKTSTVPENKQSGQLEKAALSWKYWSATATNQVVQAGLRMWVSGDPQRGINWNMIGKHLRGRLTPDEYEQIGTLKYMLDDQKNKTNIAGTYSQSQNIQAGIQLLNDARDDVRGALDALPDHDGMSYRQAGVANSSVYGGSINIGDYIRDTTFWSTSALRISGSAGSWGEDGTTSHPKVYFIINGSTGKYIAKYSGQEEGQHEVLFKDLVTFQVTKIASFRSTSFVHVTEINPATLPPNQAIKNPYNGNVY